MEKYKIEKGIPINDVRAGRNRGKYPFADMEVGDSFGFEAAQYDSVKACAYVYASKNGVKFAVRKKHLRVWRVK